MFVQKSVNVEIVVCKFMFYYIWTDVIKLVLLKMLLTQQIN